MLPCTCYSMYFSKMHFLYFVSMSFCYAILIYEPCMNLNYVSLSLYMKWYLRFIIYFDASLHIFSIYSKRSWMLKLRRRLIKLFHKLLIKLLCIIDKIIFVHFMESWINIKLLCIIELCLKHFVESWINIYFCALLIKLFHK